MAQKFGSDHTARKLAVIENYLNTYTIALKNQPFSKIYFDAFAGTGEIETGSEVGALFEDIVELRSIIDGSALRALRIKSPFDRYIFVDAREENVIRLGAKIRDEAMANRCSFVTGDANAALASFCSDTDWGASRAVIFLDPFGNQVAWETIEAVAATKAIDLWYLFPAGLGVFRQISRDGTVDETHAPSLDRLFGTTEWRKAFIAETEEDDLFGTRIRSERLVTPQGATAFMIERMKAVFAGGVLERTLPLGSRGIHMYSLIFAWGNPSKKASELAHRLASAVLK